MACMPTSSDCTSCLPGYTMTSYHVGSCTGCIVDRHRDIEVDVELSSSFDCGAMFWIFLGICILYFHMDLGTDAGQEVRKSKTSRKQVVGGKKEVGVQTGLEEKRTISWRELEDFVLLLD